MKAAAISCVIALISPVSDTVPRYDIERMCRISTTAADGTGERMAGCVRDETAARQQVSTIWPTTKSTTRATCAGDERGVKSYVELITCVQMFEAAK